jgi:hypothetical protein
LQWAQSIGNQGLATALIADRTNDSALAETGVQQIEAALEMIRSGGQERAAASWEAPLHKVQAIRDRLKGQ